MTTGPQASQARRSSGQPPKSAKKLWRSFTEHLWKAPDPDLVDAGLRGEWLVASIRLLIVVLLLYFPLKKYNFEAPEEGGIMMLWLGVAALAEALVVYSAVMRSWGRGWIGFFSGILDVTLVTLSLWVFIQLGRPEMAVQDLVIFQVYLLAIGATSLRYDWRICVLTGLAAIVEYSFLVYVAWLYEVQIQVEYQIGRVLVLTLATVLAVTLVIRALEQRSLANRDRLTSLANRGFFDESLMRIGALAARSGEPVAVAMIDVDHFKKFNDTYGHLVGDEALRVVSRILSTSFRTTDLMARYGGEEFAGLFPGLSVEDSSRRLNALRATIERTPVPIDTRGGTTRVTVSVGAAIWPTDGMNLKETLAIADLRLYQAKESGRNRVVMAGTGGADAAVFDEAPYQDLDMSDEIGPTKEGDFDASL